MKWLVHFLCIGLFLASCSEISYKEPQPRGIKALSQIPPKLQGNYLVTDGEETDTLRVVQQGYTIGNDDEARLSDSLVLKYYKGYYFLSSRDDFAWYLRVTRRQKNGDLLYLELERIPENEEERKNFITKISAVIPVVETKIDDKTYFVIDPSPKQLIELIKKGYFKEQTFTRMN
jgi:hypothetical protein